MRQVGRALSFILVLLAAGAPAAYAQQAAAHHFFTTSDKIKIHYMTQGDQGSWVVLIHGYTDSAERMWFRTGIAPALAKNHRVVAIDNRNHGQSDKPQPNGTGRAEDVIELMDHLKIDKAHIHGYSMGGGITGRLLAMIPQRFITAGFGGSGISETDPELQKQAAALDRTGPEPQGAEAAAFSRLRQSAGARDGNAGRGAGRGAAGGGAAGRGAAGRAAGSTATTTPRPQNTIDLTKITVPVIAINGEFDRPMSKTQRMWRELPVFQNVILPGKNHMSAIMVGGPMPPQYITAITGFIDMYDAK